MEGYNAMNIDKSQKSKKDLSILKSLKISQINLLHVGLTF